MSGRTSGDLDEESVVRPVDQPVQVVEVGQKRAASLVALAVDGLHAEVPGVLEVVVASSPPRGPLPHSLGSCGE